MKSIYASKLYIASSRKDRIHAALLAPTNLELVQQLADDLDDEYQTPENLGDVEKPAEDEKETSAEDFVVKDADIDPEKDLVTMKDFENVSKGSSSHSAPSHSSGSHKVPESKDESKVELKDSDSKPKADTSELMPESPANEEKPAEASTDVSGTAEEIKAATVADLNVVKNTLNSREETAGVSRISEKENEVWIYYNDDTNLNNIMTDVIEAVMDLGYEDFEFNRLARSDNAIVFVKERSTERTVESVEEAAPEA